MLIQDAACSALCDPFSASNLLFIVEAPCSGKDGALSESPQGNAVFRFDTPFVAPNVFGLFLISESNAPHIAFNEVVPKQMSDV